MKAKKKDCFGKEARFAAPCRAKFLRCHPTSADHTLSLIRFVLSVFICVHLWIQIPAAGAQTLTGIDVLEAQKFAPLAGKRVGLITNQTGIDRDRRSTIDLLANAPGVKLAALF